MKHQLMFLLSFSVFLLVFNSCEPEEDPLIARFIAVGENGYAPKTIEFKEDQTNGWDFEWTFHDGTTTTQRNVSKTYSQGGDYPVTLTVRRGEEEVSTTREINIKPLPTKIYVKEVELISTLATDDGTPWDPSGSPDIYLKFSGNGASFETAVKENAGANDFPLTWTFSEPYPYYPFTSLGNSFYVHVLDKDDLGSELIAPTGFSAQEFTDPYRSVIQYDDRNGTEVKLTVEWGN